MTVDKLSLEGSVKEDAPLDPQSVYRKMKKVLARAQCKDIRFHDLRHPYVKYATTLFSNFLFALRCVPSPKQYSGYADTKTSVLCAKIQRTPVFVV